MKKITRDPVIVAQVIELMKQRSRLSFNAVALTAEGTATDESKLGGEDFYRPLGFDYPRDSHEIPLRFLAQVNCAQMPALDNFPTLGLLQLFLRNAGDSYFSAEDDGEQGYAVIYHEHVDMSLPQAPLPDGIYSDEEGDFPFARNFCMKMNFKQETASINGHDYRLDKLFQECWKEVTGKNLVYQTGYKTDELALDQLEWYDSEKTQHRIGGYPVRCQDDPREDNETLQEKDVLLFQLGPDFTCNREDDMGNIMWGDCGVANFFISTKDLQDRRFDRVHFSWDC